ncbi:hypothetical protein D3C83_71430 [compost metagenome]
MTPKKPLFIAAPKVSFTCMNTADFGATPVAANTSSWLAKASPRIIGAVGKLRNTNL